MAKECPKCGADISDSYQEDEPDVGITGGWFCEVCNLAVGDNGDSYPIDN
jgi:hypothetical protein